MDQNTKISDDAQMCISFAKDEILEVVNLPISDEAKSRLAEALDWLDKAAE